MKTYFSGLIPKIQDYSKKLDDLTIFQNQNWVLFNEIQNNKIVYIFRSNGQLLISENGFIKKGLWEYINSKNLLIDDGDNTFLFKPGFIDSNIMALKLDGSEEYAFFLNESNANSELKNFQEITSFLKNKYLLGINMEKKFFCQNTKTLKEYGPYTSSEIMSKLKKGDLNISFYIRKEQVPNYNDKLSLKDLLKSIRK